MASWQSMSKSAIKSALFLRKEKGHQDFRASVNRSYYAVYFAIAHKLPKGLVFPHDRKNPPHDHIPTLIHQHQLGRSKKERTELIRAFNFLKDARVSADYKPGETIDPSRTLGCLKKAQQVLRSMEVI